MPSSKFNRYRQPFRCVECGKNTTGPAGVLGPQLCPACYERAGIENEHLDYGHSNPVTNCPLCEQDEKGIDKPENTV